MIINYPRQWIDCFHIAHFFIIHISLTSKFSPILKFSAICFCEISTASLLKTHVQLFRNCVTCGLCISLSSLFLVMKTISPTVYHNYNIWQTHWLHRRYALINTFDQNRLHKIFLSWRLACSLILFWTFSFWNYKGRNLIVGIFLN